MVICIMFLHDTHQKTVCFLVMPALHVLQLIVRPIAIFDFKLTSLFVIRSTFRLRLFRITSLLLEGC